MKARCWGIVPAAGVGQRMGAGMPKQYLTLRGRCLLDHSISRLLSHPRLERIVVALAEDDPFWPHCEHAGHPRVLTVTGGVERCHSVWNALQVLAPLAKPTDWVLVHDAARPCLRRSDLERLIATVEGDGVGGLLACPVRDTMKQANSECRVMATLPRETLWHAQTPQMFRLADLIHAIGQTLAEDRTVTDEAQAMEAGGFQPGPLLVEGHADNLKVTRPEDLALAAFYLENPPDDHTDRPRL
ncbi:2-C-methyl-D-erythritol 4-phosphate cytidylyltransferase [Gammaproteobacteria bacterium]